MRSAARTARNLLPSVEAPKGGVNASPRAAGASGAGGLDQVPLLLASLIEAVRAGVIAFSLAVRMLPASFSQR